MILSIVPVDNLACWPYSLFPTNNVIFICHMIGDRWFESVRKWLFPTSPRRFLVANSLHFWLKVPQGERLTFSTSDLKFLKASAELSPCFPYAHKITVSTWGLIDGMSGIKLVTLILWVNNFVSDGIMWTTGCGNVLRFRNSWNPFSDPLHIWKYHHAPVLSSVSPLLRVFLGFDSMQLTFNFFKCPFRIAAYFQRFLNRGIYWIRYEEPWDLLYNDNSIRYWWLYSQPVS